METTHAAHLAAAVIPDTARVADRFFLLDLQAVEGCVYGKGVKTGEGRPIELVRWASGGIIVLGCVEKKLIFLIFFLFQ
ncbi:unnamed protein product [Linum tenue]|uniref:Uncharacterized protein n=1 Tax=Linum tenue TaxID=586396 RepID=A0AAV0S1E9_9ROSI|nr:unnamed protein product [Linum tenue]